MLEHFSPIVHQTHVELHVHVRTVHVLRVFPVVNVLAVKLRVMTDRVLHAAGEVVRRVVLLPEMLVVCAISLVIAYQ